MCQNWRASRLLVISSITTYDASNSRGTGLNFDTQMDVGTAVPLLLFGASNHETLESLPFRSGLISPGHLAWWTSWPQKGGSSHGWSVFFSEMWGTCDRNRTRNWIWLVRKPWWVSSIVNVCLFNFLLFSCVHSITFRASSRGKLICLWTCSEQTWCCSR